MMPRRHPRLVAADRNTTDPNNAGQKKQKYQTSVVDSGRTFGINCGRLFLIPPHDYF